MNSAIIRKMSPGQDSYGTASSSWAPYLFLSTSLQPLGASLSPCSKTPR